MERYEDLNICAECGGLCCKKSGCDYYVSDFEKITLDCIEEILSSGYVSIIATLDFKTNNKGKLIVNPILSLRARNRNREIIDLLSMKTTCLSLENDRCRYSLEDRPGGGASKIPGRNLECYSKVNKLEELKKWLPYQKILQRIVKRHTGMSVDAKLRQDVIKLFDDVLNNNYKGVSEYEILDIKELMPYLIQAYPVEYAQIIKKRASKALTLQKLSPINKMPNE